MKTILCYGDSLTFGADPAGGRHPYEDRWPTTLGKALGEDKVRVIAEGLGGRTTVFDDWAAMADRNGGRILPTLLSSHTPLDAVVIMLGTNDLKQFICGEISGIASGMKQLVRIIQNFPFDEGHPTPEICIMAPPHVVDTDHVDLSPMFGAAKELSKQFAPAYARIAQEMNISFFDTATVAVADPLDGVHLDATNTRAIGEGVAPTVQKMLGL